MVIVKQESSDELQLQNPPKDVFEFETNNTPDADNEDKKEIPIKPALKNENITVQAQISLKP